MTSGRDKVVVMAVVIITVVPDESGWIKEPDASVTFKLSIVDWRVEQQGGPLHLVLA